MNIFHISEIVDMGIEKEKKRRDFYAAAAAAFKQIDTKKLFLELRDWEQAHIEKFTMIRETLNEQETFESYPGELSAYMQALVEERLYEDVSVTNFKKNVKSPVDAAIYGMGFEKDAILFFSELAKHTSPEHGQIIQQLIEEEKKHLIYLAELKQRLTAKNQKL